MRIASSTDRETRGIWKAFPAASAQARPRRAHDRFLSRPDISTNSSKGSNKTHFRVAASVHIYIPSGREDTSAAAPAGWPLELSGSRSAHCEGARRSALRWGNCVGGNNGGGFALAGVLVFLTGGFQCCA